MNEINNPKVFIGIENKKDNLIKVFPARDYQTKAYNIFMTNKFNKSNKFINYNYNNNYIFSIVNFDSSFLKGYYPSFCVLINNKNEKHILSNDKELLTKFIGWRNRLVSL